MKESHPIEISRDRLCTVSRTVQLGADVSYHEILAKNLNDFPSGYNGNKSYVQARLAITFFFSLSERLDTALPQ